MGAALAIAALAAPASAAVSPDWILVVVRAGAGGAEGVVVRVEAEAIGDGTDPGLAGFGSTHPGALPTVDVLPVGGGPLTVTTTSDAGSVRVRLLEGAPGQSAGLVHESQYDRLDPAARVSVLVFVAGMRFVGAPATTVESAAGTVSVDVRAGAGSTALAVADPGDAGVGAAAGPIGASGESRHVGRPQTGVVGGFVTFDSCVACVSTWEAPDGARGALTSSGTPLVGAGDGSGSFAGPPGTWRWTWSGFALARDGVLPARVPAFAAYAPVGDAWVTFRLPG